MDWPSSSTTSTSPIQATIACGRIDASGVISTVAGTGVPGNRAEGVAANISALNFPCAIAIDANNDLSVMDWQNYLIRKVTFGALISAGGIVNAASFTSPVRRAH